MAIVNNSHKRAAKLALAWLVTHETAPEAAALAVGEAAVTMGLQLGDMDSVAALARYAYGIQGTDVQFADSQAMHMADRLVAQANKEWEEILLH